MPTLLDQTAQPLALYSTAAAVALAGITTYAVFAANQRAPNQPRRTIPSPRTTFLPRLSPAQAARLAYPPDVLPGRRDVDTPYGSMRVYEWGPEAGRKVIFVHGDATPCPMFKIIADDLVAKGCRVMMFDLWGRGYTDTPAGLHHDSRLYSLQIQFALTSSAIAWTGDGVAPFSLVGFSMGGSISLDFFAHQPKLVQSIVLLGPGGLISNLPDEYKSLWFHYPSLISRATMRALVGTLLGVEHSRSAAQAAEDVEYSEEGFTPGGALQFQFDHHPGHVDSFLSTIQYGPLHHQEAIWERAGSIVKGVQPGKGDQQAPMSGGKILVVCGESDTVVVADEVFVKDNHRGRKVLDYDITNATFNHENASADFRVLATVILHHRHIVPLRSHNARGRDQYSILARSRFDPWQPHRRASNQTRLPAMHMTGLKHTGLHADQHALQIRNADRDDRHALHHVLGQHIWPDGERVIAAMHDARLAQQVDLRSNGSDGPGGEGERTPPVRRALSDLTACGNEQRVAHLIDALSTQVQYAPHLWSRTLADGRQERCRTPDDDEGTNDDGGAAVALIMRELVGERYRREFGSKQREDEEDLGGVTSLEVAGSGQTLLCSGPVLRASAHVLFDRHVNPSRSVAISAGAARIPTTQSPYHRNERECIVEVMTAVERSQHHFEDRTQDDSSHQTPSDYAHDRTLVVCRDGLPCKDVRDHVHHVGGLRRRAGPVSSLDGAPRRVGVRMRQHRYAQIYVLATHILDAYVFRMRILYCDRSSAQLHARKVTAAYRAKCSRPAKIVLLSMPYSAITMFAPSSTRTQVSSPPHTYSTVLHRVLQRSRTGVHDHHKIDVPARAAPAMILQRESIATDDTTCLQGSGPLLWLTEQLRGRLTRLAGGAGIANHAVPPALWCKGCALVPSLVDHCYVVTAMF
nr:serine hydrolase-like protein [Quercus suber]